VTVPPSSDALAANDGDVRLLDDVCVLEIANLAPTQLAMYLADFGADVIKVEPPARGDATRLLGVRPGHTDSALHRRWNRGKRSLAVDTTTPAGLDILRRLIPQVDVIIEGLRPGTLEKMGLGWADLTALNPTVVMIALSGYGQTGPYRDLPSHGVGFDAIAGLGDVTQDDQGRTRINTRNVNIGTNLAPLLAATATLAALSWSRRSNKPVLLDIAQADVAAFANLDIERHATDQRATPTQPASSGVNGNASGRSGSSPPPPTMQAYRTADGGALLLMALERKFLERLADAVGRQDLLDQIPQGHFVPQGNTQLDNAICDIIASKNLTDWMQIFADADVPAVPINDGERALDDPQLQARLEWLDAAHGTVTMKTPVKSQPRLADPPPSPAIGEHTIDILTSLGLTQPDIDQLAQQGVIRAAPTTA
jgi:crotonobetainyl-CoA:carnitine CoA-transferase CaiB-like acyl-CoA transferase